MSVGMERHPITFCLVFHKLERGLMRIFLILNFTTRAMKEQR